MDECFIENESDLMDGIKGGNAVRRADKIEIWDEDFSSFIGFMPVGTSAEAINCAIGIYEAGRRDGKVSGEIAMQHKFRALLGIKG